MSTQLINVHNLRKSFSGRDLFNGVSFGFEQGEHAGLVGPNGAGKSTLLKILAGLADSDGGTVSRKKGLKFGFVAQTPEFKPGALLMDTILEKAEDPHEAMSKAYEVMAHLNLNTLSEDQVVDKLSGGWKKRVALARELVLEPELLLLDEPTNHLDISSILWLEEYLSEAPFAYLMITHDRLLLSRLVNRILDLDPANMNALLDIRGGYTAYLEAKELDSDSSKRHEWVQKNQLRREKEWLSRGSIARQTKQSARKQGAAELQESVDELRVRNQSRSISIEFGEAEHSPQKLLECKGISKAFAGRTLFENLDLLVTPKSRLALLGDNGCGKSTLIKILMGEVEPDQGTVRRADKLQVAYFEQTRETLNPELSVLKNLCPDGDYVFCQGSHMHVRSYMDRFMFRGQMAELPVRKLSGGEQARLRLAQLMLTSCQVLILDEPTNDLDADTLHLLEQSLRDFKGAVILVTHDRYFMDAVSNAILAFPPTPQSAPVLERFASYFQWEEWRASELQRVKAQARAEAKAASAPKKSRLSYKEKFELENMEANILKLETQIGELTAESQSPEVLSDHKRLNEILAKLASLQSELDAKYQRWTDLEARQ